MFLYKLLMHLMVQCPTSTQKSLLTFPSSSSCYVYYNFTFLKIKKDFMLLLGNGRWRQSANACWPKCAQGVSLGSGLQLLCLSGRPKSMSKLRFISCPHWVEMHMCYCRWKETQVCDIQYCRLRSLTARSPVLSHPTCILPVLAVASC